MSCPGLCILSDFVYYVNKYHYNNNNDNMFNDGSHAWLVASAESRRKEEIFFALTTSLINHNFLPIHVKILFFVRVYSIYAN